MGVPQNTWQSTVDQRERAQWIMQMYVGVSHRRPCLERSCHVDVLHGCRQRLSSFSSFCGQRANHEIQQSNQHALDSASGGEQYHARDSDGYALRGNHLYEQSF